MRLTGYFIFLGLFTFETASHTDDEMCIPFRRSQLSAPYKPEIRQGRPGKIGPQGPPGPKGSRGEPGRCGCDPSEIQRLNDKIQSLQEIIQQTVNNISFIENRVTSTNFLLATCSVGLKDRRVRDLDITASSSADSRHSPSNGRLDYSGRSSPFISSGWAAKTVAAGEWIQVDLRQPTYVTGVITQGRSDSDQWLTSFTVSYGNSTSNMQTIRASTGNNMIFQGNYDRNSYVLNRFPVPVTARYFRIVAQTWRGYLSTRFELISC